MLGSVPATANQVPLATLVAQVISQITAQGAFVVQSYVDAGNAANAAATAAAVSNVGALTANINSILAGTLLGATSFGSQPTGNGSRLVGSASGSPVYIGVDPASQDTSVALALLPKGTFGLALGNFARDRGFVSRVALSSGNKAVLGDVQATFGTLFATSGSNTTPVILTSDGNTAGPLNQIAAPASTPCLLRVKITAAAFDSSSWVHAGTNFYSAENIVVFGATGSAVSIAAQSGWANIVDGGTGTSATFSVAANQTNNAAQLTFTPPTSNTVPWAACAKIETLEHY